ncbi:MAG: Rha family transcriptional regulator [Peptostreptococcaceae bacterium]
MNQLMALNGEMTMGSVEIAELTGKQHRNVKRDVEKMIIQLGGNVLKFERIYLDSKNRRQTEYRLDRRHVECLLTGYRAELRMKVIDRMRELESELSKKSTPPAMLPDFSDPVAMARAWADSEEKKRNLELVLQSTTAYYDVLRVVKANPDSGLKARSCWRPLKKWCEENGKKMEKVYCPRFGEVNAYPREAWLSVYPDLALPNEAGELVKIKAQ